MQKQRAFTLIELLVVIATIGLLASIVLVSLKGGREKAQIAKTLQWARSIKAQLGGDIVGDWNFNEGQGTTAYSATGYNNGTLGGTTSCTAGQCPGGSTGACPCWTDGVQGLTGKALYFDGSDDYVDCGTAPDVDYITIEAWVKPLATGNKYIVSSARDMSPVAGGYHLRISGSNFQGQIWIDSNSSLQSKTGAIVTLDEWQHVAFTFNGTNLIMYKNGVAGTPTTIPADTILKPAYPLRIGTHSMAAPLYLFNGTIDEVRIYNRALTTSEIQKHYADGAERHQLAEK